VATAATIGSELVGLFAEQLQALDVTLPDRQHFAPGQIPAMDGEQLVGNLVGIAQGGAGLHMGVSMHPAAVRYAATFSVALLRSIPIVQAEPGPYDYVVPSSADIHAAGVESIEDAEALLKSAQAIHGQYLLTGQGQDFETGPLQTIGPEGGLAGPKILVTLTIG
jgi:hypothetical protein